MPRRRAPFNYFVQVCLIITTFLSFSPTTAYLLTKNVSFCSREYLRIKSVQPDPDYDSCNEFLTRQAHRLGLDYHITEMVKGKPIFIMTWPGTEPDLPSVLLNSHTDVVPVYEGINRTFLVKN